MHSVRLIQLAVMGLLLLAYLAGAVMRYISAEVFAMAFHVFHIIGHVVLLINIIYQYDPSSYVYVYGLLLLLGTELLLLSLTPR